MSYTLDLSANVPLYGQEMCYWCGAATAQMIRNGYPNPADCLFITQTDLWNSIQIYNSTDPADVGWATDPHGLQGCLQNASNPPGVNWVERADTDRDATMFYMLYWMNVRRYPSGVLINYGGHWVSIVGFTTDVEPVSGSSPTLESIIVHDPEPHNVGTDSTMTAAAWYGSPWAGPIIYSGTWYNKYVAIVEPPVPRGRIKVKQVSRVGKRIITPAQAVEYAHKYIKQMKLAKQSRYELLGHKDIRNLEPVLVREESVNKKIREVPQYYIVPFGLKSEYTKHEIPTARVCILVNASTGDFEEVTTFGKAVRYLSREQAVNVVASAMRREAKKLKVTEAALMFQPSEITHIRAWPFWRIKTAERVFYVDQLGTIYGIIKPSIPGD